MEVYYVAAVQRRKLTYACKLLCVGIMHRTSYTVCE